MKEEGIINNAFEAILKEFQLVLTLLYLYMVGIGMVFTYFKYSSFGINIFYYADIFDFLIAPFRNIKIIYLALLSTVIPFLFYRFDIWTMKKWPKFYGYLSLGFDRYEWYGRFRIIVFSILVILFMLNSAIIFGKESAQEIKKKKPTKIEFVSGEQLKATIIGKTKEILFVLDGEEVKAIPLEADIKYFTIGN